MREHQYFEQDKIDLDTLCPNCAKLVVRIVGFLTKSCVLLTALARGRASQKCFCDPFRTHLHRLRFQFFNFILILISSRPPESITNKPTLCLTISSRLTGLPILHPMAVSISLTHKMASPNGTHRPPVRHRNRTIIIMP